MSQSPVLPAPAPSTPARWAMRIGAWLLVLGGFLLLVTYDVPLMRWRYAAVGDGLNGLAKQILVGFRDFGQIVPITVTLIIVAVYDRRRATVIGAVLLAQLIAAATYNPGKLLIARYRPFEAIEEVADLSTLTVGQTWIGFSPGNTDSGMQSFPSGHSGAAFAFAAVLVWFYPRLRWLLWILAAGCAASRFVDGVHWLSDCLAGAAVGYVAAWLALRPYVWTLPLRRFRRRRRQPTPA